MTSMIALMSLFGAEASELPYRQLVLDDGRDLKVQIVASAEKGLLVRTPQGVWMIDYNQMEDMVPIQKSDYDYQEPLKVWVHAPGREEQMEKLFEDMYKVELLDNEDVSDETIGQLEACEADFMCMSNALRPFRWVWLVTVVPSEEGEQSDLTISSRPSTGNQVTRLAARDDKKGLWTASREAIELIAVDPAQLRSLPTVSNEIAIQRTRSKNGIFLPVPGYVSLQRGRTGSFALALATATAGAGVTAAAMSTSEDIVLPQTVGLSIVTFYSIGLISNVIANK